MPTEQRPARKDAPRVTRVLERVTDQVRRHAMLPAGETILVACSGGPDSTCLLHALHRLERLFRIRLVAFHFDHGLRAGSSGDAAYVRGQAERLGIPFALRASEGEPPADASPEAWARMARYAALADVAEEQGSGRVAIGHSMDDQAETVLLGLVRGGGLDAVAGIAPVASVPPRGLTAVRPLLEVTREETAAFCRALGLRPRRDPWNRDRRFLRTRIRLDVIPALERSLDRNVRSTLARTGSHVRGDAALLDAMASAAATEVVRVDADEVCLDAARLTALPEPIGARVVRDALRAASASGGEWVPDVETTHVRAVLDLARGRPGRRADLPAPLLAERDRGYVRVARASTRRASPQASGRSAPRRR